MKVYRKNSGYTNQNARGQSDCRIFKSIISLEQMMKRTDFLHADTSSLKLWS